MGAYLARRLMLMILTLFGISIIIFVLLRIMPGNIVDILYDAAGYVNPQEKAKIGRSLASISQSWCNTSPGSVVSPMGTSVFLMFRSGLQLTRSCPASR